MTLATFWMTVSQYMRTDIALISSNAHTASDMSFSEVANDSSLLSDEGKSLSPRVGYTLQIFLKLFLEHLFCRTTYNQSAFQLLRRDLGHNLMHPFRLVRYHNHLQTVLFLLQ